MDKRISGATRQSGSWASSRNAKREARARQGDTARDLIKQSRRWSPGILREIPVVCGSEMVQPLHRHEAVNHEVLSRSCNTKNLGQYVEK